MARRSGMMTALQAALAGFSGGIEGRMQQRAADEEKSRVAAALERQARMDTAAADRQSMLDQIALGEKGFVERGVREERAKAAAPALGSMVSTALSSFGMGGGPAGVLPDMSTVQKAAGTYRNAPAQSFNVGGKTYEQMQTKQERDAMDMAQDEEAKARQLQQAERVKATEAQRVTALKAADRQAQIAQYESLGYNKKDATMLVDNASAFTAMRGQDISAATSRESQSRTDARADRDYALRVQEQQRREADSALRRERLPSGAQSKLAGFDSGVLMVGDVRSMIEQNKDAIGPIKGRVFRSILDANDKAGVGTRAAIESLSGEIRNQRFGGALTANEAKFAESMLPSEKDEAENALKKLEQLESYLERKREGIFRVYKQPYERINAVESSAPKASGIKEW